MDISVIVPLYNGKRYIKHIIWMIEQNYEKLMDEGQKKQIEIIFVNDNPLEVIEEDICRSNKIENILLLINTQNCGIHKTRITGLQNAKGEYVLFLDQDDEITNNYLFSQLQYIGNADVVLCNGIFRTNKRIYRDESYQHKAVVKENYLFQQALIISPGQVLMRKEKIPQKWKTILINKNGSDDVLLWILMMVEQRKFGINPELAYCHKEDGTNASFDFLSMKESIEELLDVVKTNKILKEEDLKVFSNSIFQRIGKYDKYIYLNNNWEEIMFNMQAYLKDNKFERIAIYGYGVIGKKLYFDLEKRGIFINCFIDRDAESYAESNIEVYTALDIKHIIDLVIITPLFDVDRIQDTLNKQKLIRKQVSLQDFTDR